MRPFFLLVTCSFILIAQVDTGTVSGLITDKSGSVIPGAIVAVKQDATNLTTTLTSNESGFYSAPSLRPGNYVVSVTRDGFRPQKSAPFDLRVQDRVEVNFQLEVGAVTSEIAISAVARGERCAAGWFGTHSGNDTRNLLKARQ